MKSNFIFFNIKLQHKISNEMKAVSFQREINYNTFNQKIWPKNWNRNLTMNSDGLSVIVQLAMVGSLK